jgi:hypothetical protein
MVYWEKKNLGELSSNMLSAISDWVELTEEISKTLQWRRGNSVLISLCLSS